MPTSSRESGRRLRRRIAGSEQRHLLGVKVDTDLFADGHDVVAAGALAAELDLATPPIAVAASSFPQEAFLAGRTFIDCLGDQPLLPTQLDGEVGECRSARSRVTEPVGA